MASTSTQRSIDVNNLFSVKGRVALITGGTSGIGLMIAKVAYGIILLLDKRVSADLTWLGIGIKWL
jgi:NADP-dependent 3-hydroxy acid dehydrogenase YdfG